MIKRIRIQANEIGLLFKHGEFKKFLGPGVNWILSLSTNIKIIVVSQLETYLSHKNLSQEELEQVACSGLLGEQATVLNLTDNERALVWRDKRFNQILGPGVHILWGEKHDIDTEIVDASAVIFNHKQLPVILHEPSTAKFLQFCFIEEGHVGLFFRAGKYVETLTPGHYAFWKKMAKFSIYKKDIREKLMDIPGQEVMTADKVTLRLNAVVSYRIYDPLQAVLNSEAVEQAFYREAQLTIRGMIGTHELDELLYNQEKISKEMEQALHSRMNRFGIQVNGLGIRDFIIPTDIRVILNRVIEARKIAEANLLARREETSATRNQATTARFYENNPMLMRLKELEVLEKVATSTNLKVILGDKKLSELLLNLV